MMKALRQSPKRIARTSIRNPLTLFQTTKGDTLMTKMTYVDALNFAIANLSDDTVVEKLTALRDATIKRNTKTDKVTPKEQAKMDADAAIKQIVREVLTGAEPMTVTQIKDANEGFAEVKTQKLSAIIRKMMMDGEILRTEVKHKAVFALA